MKNHKTICIDFDGVIHRYSKGYKGSIYDKPVKKTKWALMKMLTEGYKLVIYTSYPKPEEIKPWLKKRFGKRIANSIEIVGGKPKARIYIDDRAIRFRGNWKDILNYLR